MRKGFEIVKVKKQEENKNAGRNHIEKERRKSRDIRGGKKEERLEGKKKEK